MIWYHMIWYDKQIYFFHAPWTFRPRARYIGTSKLNLWIWHTNWIFNFKLTGKLIVKGFDVNEGNECRSMWTWTVPTSCVNEILARGSTFTLLKLTAKKQKSHFAANAVSEYFDATPNMLTSVKRRGVRVSMLWTPPRFAEATAWGPCSSISSSPMYSDS